MRLIFALCLLAAVGGRALADPQADSKQHADEGVAAYNLGDFARAVGEFRVAYQLVKNPAYLFSIAQAYRQLGDNKSALWFYHSYLRSAPQAANRANVEKRVHELEAQGIVAAPPPAVAEAPPRVMPTATATADPRTSPHDATPNATTPSATAPDATVAVTPAASIESTPRSEDKPVYKHWWLWTAVGAVVVVGVAVGLGVGLSGGRADAPGSPLGNIDVYK